MSGDVVRLDLAAVEAAVVITTSGVAFVLQDSAGQRVELQAGPGGGGSGPADASRRLSRAASVLHAVLAPEETLTPDLDLIVRNLAHQATAAPPPPREVAYTDQRVARIDALLQGLVAIVGRGPVDADRAQAVQAVRDTLVRGGMPGEAMADLLAAALVRLVQDRNRSVLGQRIGRPR